jgi:hypothetical protein
MDKRGLPPDFKETLERVAGVLWFLGVLLLLYLALQAQLTVARYAP